MFSNKLLNISEFAKLAGVSRQTLIYYDKIGLFSPAFVAENKYRMYSHNQVDNIGIITILEDLGVPLKKIREILADISVETMSNTFAYQLDAIQKKIEKLELLRDMTEIRLEQLREGARHSDGLHDLHITEIKEDIPIYLGGELNGEQHGVGDAEVMVFFETIEKTELPLIFTFGYVKNGREIQQGIYDKVSNMWFRLKNEQYSNSNISKGKYLIGYCKGYYGNTNYIYDELMEYVKKNNLHICGKVYEEYLIDEMSEKNPDEFVVKIIVKVE